MTDTASKTITRLESGRRMSEAVVRGDMIYLAGQVGEGATVTEQCQSALAQVDRLLALAGSSKANILTTQIWLADIGDFAEMNAVWDAWVDQANPPARATGEAKLATPAYKVEFIVTACR
ncbi:RidA family protein [Pararhodobacter aggregans]|uniref:RidA family protein n=1 Tax=Pararhodobacter aggregans TaxID=404875 RepID=UPI003A8D343C